MVLFYVQMYETPYGDCEEHRHAFRFASRTHKKHRFAVVINNVRNQYCERCTTTCIRAGYISSAVWDSQRQSDGVRTAYCKYKLAASHAKHLRLDRCCSACCRGHVCSLDNQTASMQRQPKLLRFSISANYPNAHSNMTRLPLR